MMVSAVLGSRAAVCSSKIRNSMGVMVDMRRAMAWRWAAGKDSHLHIHLILQSQPQGAEGFAVILQSQPVGSRPEVKGLSLIVCQGHVFQYGHGRTCAHGRILINPPNAALALVFRNPGDVLSADYDSSLIQRNAAADDV